MKINWKLNNKSWKWQIGESIRIEAEKKWKTIMTNVSIELIKYGRIVYIAKIKNTWSVGLSLTIWHW